MRIVFCLLAFAIAGALAAVAEAVVEHPDVSYDIDSPPLDPGLNAVDIYTPEGASGTDARPVVVYVHGGGWRIGDKSNSIDSKVALFTGAGYVFASVNYRLSPTDPSTLDPARLRFPDHPHDVGEAIGWISKNVARYGGDPTRILLVGHSAGAHLVSLVATDHSYVDAYGVQPWQLIGAVSLDTDAFDVADRIGELDESDRSLFYNAFGSPSEESADPRWAAASPVRWADANDPRQLLVTQARSANRIADNQRMASELGQDPAGVFLAPYNHEGINDAVGSPTDSAGETAAIMGFFAARVKAAKDPVAKLRAHPPALVRTQSGHATVEFELHSRSNGARFECRLDSRKLRHCPSQRKVVADRGRHTFRYRAIAPSGRPGVTEVFRFRVTG